MKTLNISVTTSVGLFILFFGVATFYQAKKTWTHA